MELAVMDIAFDFQLHDDPATLRGTLFMEITPGRYKKLYWQAGSRFIHEETFCLFAGIFERRFPAYAHYGFSEIPKKQWELILSDLAALHGELIYSRENELFALPTGRGSLIELPASFEAGGARNRLALAQLIFDLDVWLSQTLESHEVVTVLGI